MASPVSKLKKRKMTIRRCRCITFLLVLSSMTLLYYLLSSSPKNTISNTQPQILHETQQLDVNIDSKWDDASDDKDRYDEEIELTDEDVKLAAEHREHLRKQGKIKPLSKWYQTAKKPIPADLADEIAKKIEKVVAKDNGISTTLSPDLKQANLVTSGVSNKSGKSATHEVTTVKPNAGWVPIENTTPKPDIPITRQTPHQPTEKYGNEIIAEPSGIIRQEDASRSRSQTHHENTKDKQLFRPRSRAKVRAAHLNPAVFQQLNLIHKVGQQLHDVQSYMQDDRIYYQYHKNRSRMAYLPREKRKLEEARQEKILRANNNIKDIQIPTTEPMYEHGYPIVFEAASSIPQGKQHHDVRDSKHNSDIGPRGVPVPYNNGVPSIGVYHGNGAPYNSPNDIGGANNDIRHFNGVPRPYNTGVPINDIRPGIGIPYNNGVPFNSVPQVSNLPPNRGVPHHHGGVPRDYVIPHYTDPQAKYSSMHNRMIPTFHYGEELHPHNEQMFEEHNYSPMKHVPEHLQPIPPTNRDVGGSHTNSELVNSEINRHAERAAENRHTDHTVEMKPVSHVKEVVLDTSAVGVNSEPSHELNGERSGKPITSADTPLQHRTPPTTIPSDVKPTPVEYEHLPYGDITVHQTPSSINKTLNNENSTLAKGKSTTNKDKQQQTLTEAKHTTIEEKNKDEQHKQDMELSQAFIMLLANTTRLNDTVATVSSTMTMERPATVHLKNDHWQVHESEQAMYLYSAYYDDRPALDRHKVRIIGIANAEVKNPHCLLWYSNQSSPDVAMAVLTKIGPKIQPLTTSPNRYEPYIFTCAVLRNKGPPEKVSMITISETHPTTLLNVQLPSKPDRGQEIEVGQCMSVVYWHQDPNRLIEWLELNRMWGVGEITVYGNNLDQGTSAIFKDYVHQGLVDFRQMPNILDDDSEFTILLNMSPAINDCMYRNMYRYKKVLCTDVDEMIVPRMAGQYSEMLGQILAAKPTDHPHPSFMFRNVYFFTDFGPTVNEPWFLHSQRYLKHIKPSEFGYSVKSITDPQACIALQNHLCWKRIRKYDTKHWSIDVPVNYGRNQHYKSCHFDAYLGQLGACQRMMKEYEIDHSVQRFGKELYDRVAQKLIDFNIADIAPDTTKENKTIII